jgi:ribose 5-phosphate isomerase B
MGDRIAVGADHGGYFLKEELIAWLLGENYNVTDLGAHTFDQDDDYPDFAEAVAEEVSNKRATHGLIICGSGVGASITANKIVGIRAALCHDTYSAHQGVEHDSMNILCLGARIVGIELSKELITSFLRAKPLSDSRFQRRLKKLLSIEHAKFKDG